MGRLEGARFDNRLRATWRHPPSPATARQAAPWLQLNKCFRHGISQRFAGVRENETAVHYLKQTEPNELAHFIREGIEQVRRHTAARAQRECNFRGTFHCRW